MCSMCFENISHHMEEKQEESGRESNWVDQLENLLLIQLTYDFIQFIQHYLLRQTAE